MSRKARKPDVDRVLGGLKDFQRDTVEYVFRRMYTDEEPTGRFLVADEVGLGKTLVARGVIARAIDHLWDRVDRIDVVYICSNAEIARQNILKLNITGEKDFALASRITLLPIQLQNLVGNKLNFVSFTPGTSFELRSNLGTMQERALLYWLLREAWNLGDAVAPVNVLQGGAYAHNFRRLVREFDRSRIDRGLKDSFATALDARVTDEQARNIPDLRSRFDHLCRSYSRSDARISRADNRERTRLVGELRNLLAETCLRALEPDLIILDEFQRFKHLLNGDDEASLLARELFQYTDHVSSARVLMLSATPYKMYTFSDEGEEDHYRDFVDTLAFLLGDKQQAASFKLLLREYRRELFRLGSGEHGRLFELKAEIERRLRRVMVRTERLAVTADRDGMLAEARNPDVRLAVSDLEDYVSLQKVARLLSDARLFSGGDTLEYWKSSPYLLNFMEGYHLKVAFEKASSDPERSAELTELLEHHGEALLSYDDIRSYSEVDPANARLRGLLADTVDAGAWRLLWAPPSLPYYRLGAPFSDPGLQGFTKRLVFSSWRVVPRAISMLVSYEAERLAMTSLDPEAENTPEARKRRRALLRFTQADGRLTGMPVLGLLYPCATLARECDPLSLWAVASTTDGPPDLDEALDLASRKVERMLSRLDGPDAESGPEDDAWYWAAPLLLDRAKYPEAVVAWFAQEQLDAIWSAGDVDLQDDGDQSRWADHVAHACGILDGSVELGRRPADLSLVLAQLALAGPGVCALRALGRGVRRIDKSLDFALRNQAGPIAWSLRNLFNLPEAMAVVRGRGGEEPYWRSVLEYCLDGGLQAVLDEYAHVLRDLLAPPGAEPEVAVREIAAVMRSALGIRTSTLAVEEIAPDPATATVQAERHGMRNRFAFRFGQERADTGDTVTHTSQLRDAFNSPFWPFVLITTSIGQEGLDFHQYCHAVVHWNLPSNPVDLEQREGRVHRYKGHAVRKNVALKHGGQVLEATDQVSKRDDPWERLFEAARRERSPDTSDIVPYWVYPVEGGAKIERYVPALPLSRDRTRYDALRRALVMYRMVFGQPRQEDLVEHLLAHLSDVERSRLVDALRVDLSPPSDRYAVG